MSSAHQFQFVAVNEVSQAIVAEVQTLWQQNKAMDVRTMNDRSKEIIMLVRHESGALAGVSTVKKVKVKLFNNNYFYEFRCFIDQSFRQPALDTQLVIKTKEFLQQSKKDDPSPAIGMFMVVENPVLKKWTRTVWAGADFYFAGITSHGHHIRVSYFKDAFI